MAIILRIIFGNFFNYNQKKEDAVNYQNAFFVKEEINEYSDKNYLILNKLIAFNSYLFITIVFFSQYLVEILFFVYSTYLPSDKAKQAKDSISLQLLLSITNPTFIILLNV